MALEVARPNIACTTRDFVIEQYSNGPIPRSSNVATVRFCDRSLIPFGDQTTGHFRYRTSTRTSIDLFLGSNNGLFLGSTGRTFLRPTSQTYYGIYMYTAKLLQICNICVNYNKLYHISFTSWVSYDSKLHPDTSMSFTYCNGMCMSTF